MYDIRYHVYIIFWAYLIGLWSGRGRGSADRPWWSCGRGRGSAHLSVVVVDRGLGLAHLSVVVVDRDRGS